MDYKNKLKPGDICIKIETYWNVNIAKFVMIVTPVALK